MSINKIEVSAPASGLWMDGDYVNQPEGTYSFALNQIQKEEGFVSTEEGLIKNNILPFNYLLIGHIYIGDNKYVLFFSELNQLRSEIGILTKSSDVQESYKTLVNSGI